MDCFIGKFIADFSETLGIKLNFKNAGEVKIYVLNLLKKNLNSKFSNNPIYENKLQLICHILFETSHDNKELESIKNHIIMDLLLRKRIDIDYVEKKLISAIDENILILRGQIFQIIKGKIKYSTINENPLNKVMFFQFLNKEKDIIQEFVSKQKIKRIKFENNIFDEILFEYKSFDIKALSNLYNYLSNFNEYYEIYNKFIWLIDNIENLIKNNNIINNKIN